MKYDRNYLRMLKDHELVRYAKERGTTELELVLLERLRGLPDIRAQLEDLQAHIKSLRDDTAE
jgi:hypothetical protein